MKRRSFLKSIALGIAAITTAKLTKLEAAAASEMPMPMPVGNRAYVTTVKGTEAIVHHNLNRGCVFVVAANLDGHFRAPRVDPLDANSVKLTFTEPWSMTGRRKVYRVIISCEIPTPKMEEGKHVLQWQ